MSRGLDGRRALVTGAASGIGRAVVERLAADGAAVAAVDLAETEAPPGGLALVADVADEKAVEGAVAEAVARLGGLDAVVANAGVQLHGEDARSAELDLEVWERTLRTNLTGTFLTCKHGIRALLAAGGGSIVCVASVAAVAGIAAGYDAYTASKGGVLALVRALAAGYARDGIRVNAVLPGFVDTPLVAPVTLDREWLASVVSTIPLARPGTPEEIANATAWLVSDESSYATGAAFVLDGGMTAV